MHIEDKIQKNKKIKDRRFRILNINSLLDSIMRFINKCMYYSKEEEE